MTKYWLTIGIAIATLFTLAGESQAADPNDVRKLIQTNACKGCDLSHAKLSSLDLTDAVLTGANLEGADLSGANLTRAQLKSANLQSAIISKANFTGANLKSANFSNAQNSDVCSNPLIFGLGNRPKFGTLDYVDQQRCLILSLVGMLGPELCEPEFGFSKLQEGKQFCKVFDSTRGSLSTMLGVQVGSFFQVTSFYGADLTDTIFKSVDLKASDFRYATLIATNFQASNLTYAVMRDARIEGISDTQLQAAFVTNDDIKRAVQEAIATEQGERQKGKKKLGAISMLQLSLRAQQAYHLENNQFSSRLDQLDILFPAESQYRYELVPQGDRTKIVMTATSLEEGLPSFLSVATYRPNPAQTNELQFRYMICETAEPTTSLPTIPDNIEIESCPVEMILIRG